MMKISGKITLLSCVTLFALPFTTFGQEVVTVDTHVDIPFHFATPMTDVANAPLEQVTLDKMEAGGLNAAFFIVYIDQSYRNKWEYNFAKKSALKKFEAIHRMARQYPARVELAFKASDMMRIAKSGKRAAFIGIENGFVLGKDLNLLDRYYDLGARYITLVHNGHNDIADSAQPSDHFGDVKEEHGGLSQYGLQVIKKMNDLGIMVDISHASKKTMLAAAKASKTPVIASHSGVRAMVDHPRNLDDEQLMTLKKVGGVVQVAAVDSFLKHRPKEYDSAVGKIRRALGLVDFQMERFAPKSVQESYKKRLETEVNSRWPRASVHDLVNQIDYVVNLIGIDHVGIASDFEGGGGIKGWDDASETKNITAELIKRGYSKEDIGKIWGGNLLRVLKIVEAAAGK